MSSTFKYFAIAAAAIVIAFAFHPDYIYASMMYAWVQTIAKTSLGPLIFFVFVAFSAVALFAGMRRRR